jgi:AraC-like DNA-binding protein
MPPHPPSAHKAFHVILAATSPYYRRVMDGALEMARELHCNHPVSIGFPEALTPSLAHDSDGVLCSASLSSHVFLPDYPFPVVNFSNTYGPVPGTVNFLSDDVAIGRMAAKHLMQQGYRHFLCLATANNAVVHQERAQGFSDSIVPLNIACPTHFISLEHTLGPAWTRYRFVQEISERLRPLLLNLEPDTGIFATNDWMAWILLNVLHVDYPELLHTVGVLGVDNDNEISWYGNDIPELSSIVPAFHTIAREGIRWLNEHPGDAGKFQIPSEVRRFPPATLVQRSSTACGGCRDMLTGKMFRWAWDRIQRSKPVSVSHLSSQFHISRKTIYRQCVAQLGEAPGDLIDRMRFDLARHLLRGSTLSVGEISERCGFAKQDVLSRLMRRIEGCTPRDYRRMDIPPQTDGPAE